MKKSLITFMQRSELVPAASTVRSPGSRFNSTGGHVNGDIDITDRHGLVGGNVRSREYCKTQVSTFCVVRNGWRGPQWADSPLNFYLVWIRNTE